MQQLASYLSGAWQTGRGRARTIHHAITGAALWEVTSEGLDMAQARRFAIERGGKALQAMTFIERSAMLKAVAKHLLEQKDQFYAISAQTGATRADSWVDIEGGIGTLFTYAGLGSRELPDDILWPEDELIPLSKQGGFAARHVLTSKSGVAVHINAFNFPCWGMLEKLAPTWLAGMPAIIKPATATAQLTQAMVKAIVDSGLVPEGAISLICGGAGDLLDHLDSQDVVTFTGSAATGQQLRAHPNLVAKSIPFTMEADSLNCCVLGEDVTPEQPEFALFIREVVREMTAKAGQKCTAIRRIIVPLAQINAVSDALISRLHKVTVGDPAQEGVKMGALVNSEQRQDVQESVNKLIAAGCEVLLGGEADLSAAGAFFPPTLLYCSQPDETPAVHAIEAFGPVATLMPYRDRQHALTLARAGGGSLAGSVVTASGSWRASLSSARPRPWPYSDTERGVLGRVNRPRLAAAAAGARRPRPRWRRRRAWRAAFGETLYAAYRGPGQPNDAGDHRSTVGARRPGERRPYSPVPQIFRRDSAWRQLINPAPNPDRSGYR